MGIVRLKGLEFFAYHGYHAEERTIGNRYLVDVEIETDFGQAAIADDLAHTVNYEAVFAIVRDRMQVSARLLEHIAYEICESLRLTFAQARRIQVEVTKYNPPLGGVCHSASVVIAWPDSPTP
jgi:7,8-dihydroneopterin aldolase/epimerase/oxygenase